MARIVGYEVRLERNGRVTYRVAALSAAEARAVAAFHHPDWAVAPVAGLPTRSALLSGPRASGTWRGRMADRTGNPEVDALIEEFLRTPMGDWTTDDAPTRRCATLSVRTGHARSVSEQFKEFATERGFKAYATDTDLDELGYTPTGTGGEIGFNEQDEMQYGFYPEHTIATVVLDDPAYPYGREFYIDFTAAQYGYTDHPKVTT